MSVCQRICQYIDDRHIAHSYVAEKANIPLEALNSMLNGQQVMYADELRAICYALNVSADVFLCSMRAQA